MKKHSAIISVVTAAALAVTSFSFFGCTVAEEYKLMVNGGDCLYENLSTTYNAGEKVTVKVRIKPYEGVKVALDAVPLTKTKSTQDEYWRFDFVMPAHDTTLDILSYKGFEEPKLYGFYITLNDKNGDPIAEFDKPVDSKDAVADYAVVYYEDGHKVISSNSGANVFADGKQKISNIGYELENTLYFTHELLGAVAVVDWVYIDETTQKIYTDDKNAGYKLDDLGIFSTFDSQSLSDARYNGQMKEYEEKFDSNIKLNFIYLDYLTAVKVLEYGADNELIKSTDIEKPETETDGIRYRAGDNCEYVVVEEEYTVMNEEAHLGEKHYERTLINKTNLREVKALKYPRGNGLILPVLLSVGWNTAIDE